MATLKGLVVVERIALVHDRGPHSKQNVDHRQRLRRARRIAISRVWHCALSLYTLRNSCNFSRFNRWSNSPPGERQQAERNERTANSDAIDECLVMVVGGDEHPGTGAGASRPRPLGA